MLSVKSVLLICICKYTMSLPCLTNESEKDFDDSRKALSALETILGNTVNTLESDIQKTLNTLKSHLETLKSNVGSKVKTLDGNLGVLEENFRKKQWLKHDGHCYYYAQEKHDWFTAERLCRDYGGYLVKIDNSSENEWLHLKRQHKAEGYWIGLTDLIEGEWRWTIDQSLATFKAWYGSHGSGGPRSNCVTFISNRSKWLDTSCKSGYYYICERNFC